MLPFIIQSWSLFLIKVVEDMAAEEKEAAAEVRNDLCYSWTILNLYCAQAMAVVEEEREAAAADTAVAEEV